MDEPTIDEQRRIAGLLGKPARSWQRVDRGYTNARRWLARFDDGSSCFVKAASDEDTAEWLRREYRVYSQVKASFMPHLLGWLDDGSRPVLILEDLSAAHWPPPWAAKQVQSTLEALQQLHALTVSGLKPVREAVDFTGWELVSRKPDEFLALELCSRRWLERSLPVLLSASAAAPLDGDETLHLDVRSDNLCFVRDRVLLIDWNFACLGNGEVDLACWAPSLAAEGGPPPETILPNAPELAAIVAGYFAARAGLPHLTHAPGVRAVQLAQLRVALPWAQRALGLSKPDGDVFAAL